MKTVKLHFTGFWQSFDCNSNMFMYILRKRYNVILDSVDPDFIICSPLGSAYEYMKYDCPRIMYTGEFLSADFNAIDYFIGYDYIDFGDRCFRFPLHLWSEDGVYLPSEPLTPDEAKKELESKELFCNYIFGHDTVLGKREEILKYLSQYKRVECAGRQFNNMPGNQTYTIRTKRDFMKKCKFSVAAESVCYPGFTSEKLGDAFRSRTVPIYYGDPVVHKEFNEQAFVNCYSYESVEKAIDRVIEIDNNDDLYIEMLCQYRYNMLDYENIMFGKLEEFLYRIFDQDKEDAYRRPRFYNASWHERHLRTYAKIYSKAPNIIHKFFK